MARNRRRGTAKHTVRLGWPEIRGALVSLAQWVWLGLQWLGKAIVPWRLLTYCYELLDDTIFKRGLFAGQATVWENLADTFRSDTAKQQRLLTWVQCQVPHLTITDMSTCWGDGVAMCALLEALYPGSCPRYDLLKASNKVNNCRLALKLAAKYTITSQTIISAEEMALSDKDSEKKLQKLLALLKHHVDNPKPGHAPILRPMGICTAKGSGLVAGLVGKCCKFTICTPANEEVDLLVEIRGPKNEICSEKISNLVPNKSRGHLDEVEDLEKKHRGGWLWKASTARILQNGVPVISRKNSQVIMPNIKDAEKIPFDYQCAQEGQLMMSYVPRSEGAHIVVIKWQKNDVKGSPFRVAIASTMERLNQETKVRMSPHPTQQDMLPLNSMVIPTISGDAAESDVDQPALAAVLKRTSTFHRSISSTCNVPVEKLAKQTTITRRRILRRVITKAGQEIIVHEAPSDPSQDSGSSSRASSPALSDRGLNKHKHRHVSKFFDQYSYESDSSGAACSRPSTPASSQRLIAEDAAINALSFIVNEAFRMIKRKEQAAFLNMKKKEVHDNYQLYKRQGLIKRSSSDMTLLTNSSCSFDMFGDDAEVFLSGNELVEQPVRSHPALTGKYSLPLAKHRMSEPILSQSDLLSVTNEHLKRTEKDAMQLLLRSPDESEESSDTHETHHNGLENANIPVSSSVSDLTALQSSDSSWPNDITKPVSHTVTTQTDTPDTTQTDTPQTDIAQTDDPQTNTPQTDAPQTDAPQADPPQADTAQSEVQNVNQEVMGKTKVCKTLSDPPVRRELHRPKPMRANTVTGSPTKEKTDSIGPIKLLQSDSMRKVCFYLSQKAIEKNSSSSGDSVSVDFSDKSEGASCNPCVSENEQFTLSSFDSECVPVTPDYAADRLHFKELDQGGWTQTNLRLSISLPSLSKRWQAFEFDPDEDTGYDEYYDKGFPRKKRATLGASEIEADLVRLRENDSFNSMQQIKNDMKSKDHLQVHSNEIADSLYLRLITPESSPIVSPMTHSPASSPSASARSSRRASRDHQLLEDDGLPGHSGSLSRSSSVGKDYADRPLLAKVSEELSSEGVLHHESNKSFHAVKSPQTQKQANGQKFIIPKVKMDKATQVSYAEIKEATHWGKTTLQTRQRRKFIRREAIEKSSSSSMESAIAQIPVVRPSIPQIVYEQNHDIEHSVEGAAAAADFMMPDEERLQQPQRQSTVDTVDSGIADDNARQEGVASIPRLLSKQRFISGHRAVTRRHYRGKISLDPKLTSTLAESGDDSHKVEALIKKLSGSSSQGKEEAGDTIRRRSSRTRARRRVMFSRKVMMYRRSSSRSSRNSRERSRELAISLSHSSQQDPQVKEPTPKPTSPKKKKSAQVEAKEETNLQQQQKAEQLHTSEHNVTLSDSETIATAPSCTDYQNRNVFYNELSSQSCPAEIQDDNDIFNGEMIDPALFLGYNDDNPLQDKLNLPDVNTGPMLQQTSSESYDGYGVTSVTRKDLLGQVDLFSHLADHSPQRQMRSVSPGSTTQQSTIWSDMDSETTCSEFTKFSNRREVFDEWSADHLPLGEDYISFTGLLEGGKRQLSPFSDNSPPSQPEPEPLSVNELVPQASNCRAFGAGLHYGQVAVKNNFQVQCMKAGNGGLNVTITGPRPHTVKETSITYTGDDIYEVIYEVQQPGYYIISAKWADINIPESPFICKVTY